MTIVIQHGKYIKEAICPECGCKFLYNFHPNNGDLKYPQSSSWDEYDENDEDIDYNYITNKYIQCPECNYLMYLKK